MDTKEQASQPALQTLKEYAVITAAVLIMDIGILFLNSPIIFLSAVYPVWPLSSAGFFRSLPHRSTFLSTCCFCWLVLLCWGGTSASRQPT